MENMIKVIKPRGGGKTTSLLKLAEEHGYILVEPTQKSADCIRKIAETRGFQGIPIISFHQFLSDSQWSRAKYLIDELDDCLKFMGVCGYSNTELDNEGNKVRMEE
jgi:hypothetical protein